MSTGQTAVEPTYNCPVRRKHSKNRGQVQYQKQLSSAPIHYHGLLTRSLWTGYETKMRMLAQRRERTDSQSLIPISIGRGIGRDRHIRLR